MNNKIRPVRFLLARALGTEAQTMKGTGEGDNFSVFWLLPLQAGGRFLMFECVCVFEKKGGNRQRSCCGFVEIVWNHQAS